MTDDYEVYDPCFECQGYNIVYVDDNGEEHRECDDCCHSFWNYGD